MLGGCMRKRRGWRVNSSSGPIETTRSCRDRYSLAGSHGQACVYPKHVHARACVIPVWRVRSNNARRNTRLYDNEAASPKLMPLCYEASRWIDRDTFGWMPRAPAGYDFRDPPRPNENSNTLLATLIDEDSRPWIFSIRRITSSIANQNLGQFEPVWCRLSADLTLYRGRTRLQRNERVGRLARMCIEYWYTIRRQTINFSTW